MDSLPIDISLNILSRLPIFSLFHCKFVSKSWRDLADNPLLPHLHFLHQSSHTNPSLILHSSLSQDHLYLLQNCTELDDNNNHGLKGVLKKIKIPFKHHKFSSVLHCNGLLFLSQSEKFGFVAIDEISIYNPFIKKVIPIPNRESIFGGKSVYGFGFDSRSGDYKVVRIVEHEISLLNFNLGEFRVSLDQRIQVFTLGANFWREKTYNNHFLLRMQPSAALINGALHWLGKAKFSIAQIIVAFDLSDEEFRQISIPSCRFDDSNINLVLVVLGGCLSVVVHSEAKMEIWVMKKYGTKESWVKEFTIGMDFSEFGFVMPLCLLKNGKILMEYVNRELLCYDPDADSFKRLEIDKLPTQFQVVPHVEILQ